MINSIRHCYSTGDLTEFTEDNFDFFIRIEDAINEINNKVTNPYEFAAMLLEDIAEEKK